MKAIYQQYKPFFNFLIKFLGFYIVFTFVYKLYLNQYDASVYEVDGVTEMVAHQTVWILNQFDQDVITYHHATNPSMKVMFKDKAVARIVEGCNAVSVIILFAAFVFAFSNNLKRTILYIISGAIIIYLLNLLRIALLMYAFYYYPEYKDMLHDIFFPLFIYGVVFVLWVFWVVKFSKYGKVA